MLRVCDALFVDREKGYQRTGGEKYSYAVFSSVFSLNQQTEVLLTAQTRSYLHPIGTESYCISR